MFSGVIMTVTSGDVYMKGFGTQFSQTSWCICANSEEATTLRERRRVFIYPTRSGLEAAGKVNK